MSPLPRSYELSDKGPVPLEREAVYVGTGVNYEVFPAATSDLKARLRSEVRWGVCVVWRRGRGFD